MLFGVHFNAIRSPWGYMFGSQIGTHASEGRVSPLIDRVVSCKPKQILGRELFRGVPQPSQTVTSLSNFSLFVLHSLCSTLLFHTSWFLLASTDGLRSVIYTSLLLLSLSLILPFEVVFNKVLTLLKQVLARLLRFLGKLFKLFNMETWEILNFLFTMIYSQGFASCVF